VWARGTILAHPFRSVNSMQILLTNDDGVYADGLYAAWRALLDAGHDVFVCVPDRPRSACSHQITMHKPLRIKPIQTPVGMASACNGTPADCVPLALLQLMGSPPDLVVSGINLGANLGDDVHYSGTVGGAMEGVLNGFRSIAISLVTHENPLWDGAARFLAEFAPRAVALELPRDTFLNINVPNLPAAQLRGARATSQGSRRYKGDMSRHVAPIQGEYFWRGGEVIDRAEHPDADVSVIKDGWISVTPLHVDLTRRDALETVARVL